MNWLNSFLGKIVDLEIAGRLISGILIDYGTDILVVYNGKNFLYIPFAHIKHINLRKSNDLQIQPPSETPMDNQVDSISFKKILHNAKDWFIEMYVTGNQPIHGYLKNILGDYLVMHSPIFKTVFITHYHIKWLIPHDRNSIPYSLDQDSLPAIPSNTTLADTFRVQLQKHLGNVVIFDLGEKPTKAGKLQKVDDNVVELVLADGEEYWWNLRHLKTVHFP